MDTIIDGEPVLLVKKPVMIQVDTFPWALMIETEATSDGIVIQQGTSDAVIVPDSIVKANQRYRDSLAQIPIVPQPAFRVLDGFLIGMLFLWAGITFWNRKQNVKDS